MDRKGARLLCAYRAGDVTNQSEIDSDAIPIDKAPPYLHFMVIARKFAAIGLKITSASLFLRGLCPSRYNMQDTINPAVLMILSSGNLATASNLPNAFESSALLLSFL